MSTQKPEPQPRTSKSSNLKDKQIKSKNSSNCTSPTRSEEKKLPPIKAPVGLTKGPNLKNVKSKIGSFNNFKHKPQGGEKKLQTQKLEWKASSKIGSFDYAHHRPSKGEKKTITQKLEWKASSRIASLENIKHRPGGGEKKIFNERYASGRSYSEVRKPRQPSQVRSTSPTKLNGQQATKLNSKIENTKSDQLHSARPNLNQNQKTNTGHSSRMSSALNSTQANGIQQKQMNNNAGFIKGLENLSLNKPTQINTQKSMLVVDLLS